jgi:succinoglycan biosynthesis transport protein ExoP
MLQRRDDLPGAVTLRPVDSVDDDVIDLARIFAAMRRQYWPVIVMTLVGAAVGVAYVATAVPRYTAGLHLLIDAESNRLADRLNSLGSTLQDESSVLSQVEILKSERIAMAVVNQLRLDENPVFMAEAQTPLQRLKQLPKSLIDFRGWFGDSERALTDEELKGIAAWRVQQDLDVERIGRSFVLSLSFTATDPVLASTIVTEVSNAYLTEQLDSRYEATRRASVWLQERIDELRRKSLETDLAVQRFRTENDLVATDGKLVSDQQLVELSSEQIVAQTETARAESRYNRIRSIMERKDTSAVVSEALDSDVINQIRTRYLDASKREADISSRLGENHTQAVRLRTEMSEYERLIFEELSRIAQSYLSEYQVAKAREDSLRESVSRATARTANLNEVMVQLRELEREAESYKNLYQTFLQRYQEAVQQQSFPIAEARVISEASPPGVPSSPKKTMAIGLAAVLGLLFGVGIGVMRELRERFFRTGDQVRDELKLEFLGFVPSVSRRKKKAAKPATKPAEEQAATDANQRVLRKADPTSNYVVDHPMSSFAETLRSVKISADLALGSKVPKIIGVVSVRPGEGKSTISANLAELLAYQGSRTLLIDGDLRNPGLSRAVASHAQQGILDAVLDGKPLRGLLMGNPDTRLAVLPAVLRRRVPHTSEVLASQGMRRVLKEASEDFEHIIIDLPPLGPVVDARAISSQVDAFVFVVEWGKTARHAVRAILRSEPHIASKCIGVILNKADMDKVRLYGHYGSAEYYTSDYTPYYTEPRNR